jgi:hypothetical protein
VQRLLDREHDLGLDGVDVGREVVEEVVLGQPGEAVLVDVEMGQGGTRRWRSYQTSRLSGVGWVTLEAGSDGRSRSVAITPAGREKRQEAQRRWRVAQETLNECVGVERVAALHTLVDDWMVRLAPDEEGDSDA